MLINDLQLEISFHLFSNDHGTLLEIFSATLLAILDNFELIWRDYNSTVDTARGTLKRDTSCYVKSKSFMSNKSNFMNFLMVITHFRVVLPGTMCVCRFVDIPRPLVYCST